MAKKCRSRARIRIMLVYALMLPCCRAPSADRHDGGDDEAF
jgi:hypothetical protein